MGISSAAGEQQILGYRRYLKFRKEIATIILEEQMGI